MILIAYGAPVAEEPFHHGRDAVLRCRKERILPRPRGNAGRQCGSPHSRDVRVCVKRTIVRDAKDPLEKKERREKIARRCTFYFPARRLSFELIEDRVFASRESILRLRERGTILSSLFRFASDNALYCR